MKPSGPGLCLLEDFLLQFGYKMNYENSNLRTVFLVWTVQSGIIYMG